MTGLKYYAENAPQLFHRYRSRSAHLVHQDWAALASVDKETGRACDIGAGSGRDAEWLAKQGWFVVAVEPSADMRSLAMISSHSRIDWVDDCLPELPVVGATADLFDLILVSAVWQHLEPNSRQGALRVLQELLQPEGYLVITLRQGSDKTENTARRFYPVPGAELAAQALAAGLTLSARYRRKDEERTHIQWETCVFKKSA